MVDLLYHGLFLFFVALKRDRVCFRKRSFRQSETSRRALSIPHPPPPFSLTPALRAVFLRRVASALPGTNVGWKAGLNIAARLMTRLRGGVGGKIEQEYLEEMVSVILREVC